MKNTRHAARVMVMKCLYAHEITGEPIEKIKSDLLQDVTDENLLEFINKLIDASLNNISHLDKLINSKIQNWEFERVAVIDKLILRMGLCEFLYFQEIPPKVTINESIELAKTYSTSNSGRFVNGVLDALLEELIKNKLLEKAGRGLVDLKKKGNEK